MDPRNGSGRQNAARRRRDASRPAGVAAVLALSSCLLLATHDATAQPVTCYRHKGNLDRGSTVLQGPWMPTRTEAAQALMDLAAPVDAGQVVVYRCLGDPETPPFRTFTTALRLDGAGTDEAHFKKFSLDNATVCAPQWNRYWHNGLQSYHRERITCPALIDLQGGDTTRALPAGPVLPLKAVVTQGGVPVASRAVQVAIGTAVVTGVTNAAGEYPFTYVPPLLRAATESITATCTGCTNQANKLVQVLSCSACESQ